MTSQCSQGCSHCSFFYHCYVLLHVQIPKHFQDCRDHQRKNSLSKVFVIQVVLNCTQFTSNQPASCSGDIHQCPRMVGESLKSSAFSSQFLSLAMALEMVDISKWQAFGMWLSHKTIIFGALHPIKACRCLSPNGGISQITTKSSWFIILGEWSHYNYNL